MSGLSRQSELGFTLIEVVFAFAIFALSAVALFAAFSASSTREVSGSERAQATLLAQSLISGVRGSSEPWAPESNGSWGTGGRWHIRVQRYFNDAPKSGWTAYLVTVTVQSGERPGREVTLNSIELASVRP